MLSNFNILSSILERAADGIMTLQSFGICSAVALVLGIIVALIYMYKNKTYTKGFVVTLAVLPLIIEAIIAMVNGNLGIGVAVAGAFTLVRFRSAQGGGREISSVFLTMAVGLAVGMGYIGIAIMLVIAISLVEFVLFTTGFANGKKEQELKIQIPENLSYNDMFDKLFSEYTKEHEQLRVKTAGMGSVYELTYKIVMKDVEKTQEFMDEIRKKNGNLTVSMGVYAPMPREEL